MTNICTVNNQVRPNHNSRNSQYSTSLYSFRLQPEIFYIARVTPWQKPVLFTSNEVALPRTRFRGYSPCQSAFYIETVKSGVTMNKVAYTVSWQRHRQSAVTPYCSFWYPTSIVFLILYITHPVPSWEIYGAHMNGCTTFNCSLLPISISSHWFSIYH